MVGTASFVGELRDPERAFTAASLLPLPFARERRDFTFSAAVTVLEDLDVAEAPSGAGRLSKTAKKTAATQRRATIENVNRFCIVVSGLAIGLP